MNNTASPKTTSRALWALIAFLAPVLIGALLFFQTLAFAEVWDDAALLLHPLNGPNLVSWPQAVADALYGFVLSPGLYWRPLSSLTFWAPHTFCAPADLDCLLVWAHRVNYALYLAFCFAASALCWRLSKLASPANGPLSPLPPARLAWLSSPAALAALAAGLVAFHPANAEIFAWISGRFDGLLSLFLTLALISAVAPIKRAPLSAFLVFICCCLAHFSKDGAQVGCAGVAFIAFFLPAPPRRRYALAFAALASLAFCFAVRRHYAGEMNFSVANVGAAWDVIARRYVSSSSQAFSSFIQPWVGVTPAHPIRLSSGDWISCALFHALFLTCAVKLGIALARRNGAALPWAFAVCAFGTLTVSCALNAFLILNQDFVWADRYLAPVWPFLLGALALGIPRIHLLDTGKFKGLIALFLVALCALLALMFAQEVSLWRDNPTFWGRVVAEDPENIKSVNNYAHALFQSGRPHQAEKQADRGLALMEKHKRGFTETIRTAAAIKFALGKSDEAKSILALWESRGYESFDIRAQRAIILYFEKSCGPADVEREKAIQRARSLAQYKTQRDLDLLDRLRTDCYAHAR